MNIPPGFGQANIILSGVGVPRGAQWTFGFLVPTGALPLAACNIIANAWRTHIRPATSQTVMLSQVRVKFGPNATGPEAVLSDGTVGDRSNPVDSPQVAVLVTKQTASGGRSERGRCFLPGLCETDTDSGGVLTSGALTLWGGATEQFRLALATATTPMYLLHNSVEALPTPITGFMVEPLVATQRRRLRKVGGRRTLT